MKCIVFSFLSLFCLTQVSLAAENSSYEGTYKRTHSENSTMIISKNNDKWSLEIHDAGMSNGAETPDDCEIDATGSLDHDILTATPADGGGNAFKVKFSKNHATVIAQEISGCSRRLDLSGTYKKAPKAKIIGRTDKIAYECPNKNEAFGVIHDVEAEYQNHKFEDPFLTLARHMCTPVPKGTPFYYDEKTQFSFDSSQWALVRGEKNYIWLGAPNDVY